MTLVKLIVLFAGATIAAGFIVFVQSFFVRSEPQSKTQDDAGTEPPDTGLIAELEFEHDVLINQTGVAAQELLGPHLGDAPDLAQTVAQLSHRFAGLAQVVEDLPETGEAQITSQDGKLTCSAHMSGFTTRLTLRRNAKAPLVLSEPAQNDAAAFEAEEIASLRTIHENTPFLVWREVRDGRIDWANRAYLDLARRFRGDGAVQTWPPARVFELPNTAPLNEAGDAEPIRTKVEFGEPSQTHWFEVTRKPIDGGTMFTAASADALVKMESSLSEFVQTLTKTFAQLDTGLAIFDRERKLTLFNPALSDLTGLRPEFMTTRPGLQAVLDKLRDRRMIPEPRDYKTWRQQVYELETEASEGTYDEHWTLPDGRTFQVTGRPHTDGGVAFMIKNVSEELRLTREHRDHVEMYQGALDAIDEAVVVFDQTRNLLVANRAYADLWDLDAEAQAEGRTLIEASTHWARACDPSPIWGDIRAFASTYSERAEWTAAARKADGTELRCRVVPVSRGSTMIAFSREARTGMAAIATTQPMMLSAGVHMP